MTFYRFEKNHLKNTFNFFLRSIDSFVSLFFQMCQIEFQGRFKKTNMYLWPVKLLMFVDMMISI